MAYPDPIAASHIYFSEIAQGGGKSCRTHELYAETAETLLFNRYATYTNWFICTTVPEKPTDKAIEVVSQAFSDQMPQWFYDTFYDSDNKPDHRAIWAAIGRIQDGQSQLAAINQFRYSFGGYCSEADVWEFSRQNLDIEQPWRNGGC